MKKVLSLLLALILVLAIFSSAVLAVDKTAAPTASQVLVNGKSIAFEAYNIESSNYFKLRDLALALNGTSKQFEVSWDGSKNAINLLSSKAYTIVGNELQKGNGKGKTASLSTAAIYIDGVKAALTAYNINGNNFFKLRDLMSAFGVNVGWDETKNQITLDTSKSSEQVSTPAAANTNTATASKEGRYYYIRCMNNYLYINSEGKAELNNKEPRQKFKVTYIEDDYCGIQTVDGKYLDIADYDNMKNGSRVIVSNEEQHWKMIAENDNDIFSMRPIGNENMVVNASGEKNTNGTHIIIWSHPDKNAPNNAEFRFIPVK